VLLAGCGGGGGPHLARSDVAPLISLADKISREEPCAQSRDIRALDRQRVALVNARRVPATLAESFSSGVNALVAKTPPCLPRVPATTVAPPPVTYVPSHGKSKNHNHGKHEGGD
jgi:hypothetical protein